MDYTTLLSPSGSGDALSPKQTSSLYEECQHLVDGRKARGKRYDLQGC